MRPYLYRWILSLIINYNEYNTNRLYSCNMFRVYILYVIHIVNRWLFDVTILCKYNINDARPV